MLKKRITLLSTITMLTFGGYVGYVTNYTEPVTAKEVVIPKIVEIPRTLFENDIGINLTKTVAKETISNPEQNAENISKSKDSIVYITSVVKKKVEVPKYIRVRELPPIRQKNQSTCTEILKSLTSEKDNFTPQLELPMRSLSFNGVFIDDT